MLTYLDGSAAHYSLQSAESLCFVTFKCACALAIQPTARLCPCRVGNDGEFATPEYGGTVGYGQNAGVNEAFER